MTNGQLAADPDSPDAIPSYSLPRSETVFIQAYSPQAYTEYKALCPSPPANNCTPLGSRTPLSNIRNSGSPGHSDPFDSLHVDPEPYVYLQVSINSYSHSVMTEQWDRSMTSRFVLQSQGFVVVSVLLTALIVLQ